MTKSFLPDQVSLKLNLILKDYNNLDNIVGVHGNMNTLRQADKINLNTNNNNKNKCNKDNNKLKQEQQPNRLFALFYQGNENEICVLYVDKIFLLLIYQ